MDGSEDRKVSGPAPPAPSAPPTWRPRAWVRLTTIASFVLGAGGFVHEVFVVAAAEWQVLTASLILLGAVPVGVWLESLRR